MIRTFILFVRSIVLYNLDRRQRQRRSFVSSSKFTNQRMKLSFFFIVIFLLLPSVETHFLNWVWNKIQRVIDPTKAQRTFDCGQTDVRPVLPAKMDTPRVTGGLSAVDHSFPWVVNVLNVKSMKSCGGAIISPDTILTAAHCIVDPPEYLSVIAGAATLIGRLNLFNYYSVSRVILHPHYVSCCDYDLAIIKLKKKLERSKMINSICLPIEPNEQLPNDQISLIAGWGGKYPSSELNAFGSFHLKQGVVYVKSHDYCRRIYGSYDDKDEICATNERDQVDSREGDSGGPLMILNQTDHRWYLFGITSHGSNSEIIKPGVYSSVSTKLDFIRQYLSDE